MDNCLCTFLHLDTKTGRQSLSCQDPSPARGQMPPFKGGERSLLSKCLRPNFYSNSGHVCLVVPPPQKNPTPTPHEQMLGEMTLANYQLRLERERRLRVRRDDLVKLRLQGERRLQIRRDDLVKLRLQQERRLRARHDLVQLQQQQLQRERRQQLRRDDLVQLRLQRERQLRAERV